MMGDRDTAGRDIANVRDQVEKAKAGGDKSGGKTGDSGKSGGNTGKK